LQNNLLILLGLIEFTLETLELSTLTDISAEDVNLFVLKQTYFSPFFHIFHS